MDKLAICNMVKEFLDDNCNIGSISEDVNLLQDGLLDSIDVLNLIGFLEAQYGIEIPPESINGDNFDTLDKISDFVYGILKEKGDK